MWRRAIESVVALVFLSLSLATLFQAPSDPGPSPAVDPTEGEVRISGIRHGRTASTAPYAVRTTVLVRYDNPINIDSSANIHVTVHQAELSGSTSASPGAVSTDPAASVDKLLWPVELTLRSPAFDFSDGDQARRIEAGRALPSQVGWSLVPKRAGTWGLHLQVASVYGSPTEEVGFFPANRIDMEVNGEKRTLSPADDVIFSIEVERLWGVSAQAYNWLSIAFAFVGVVIGTDVFAGWSAKLLRWATGRPQGGARKTRPRRSAKTAEPAKGGRQPTVGPDPG